jgi:hypothetical protein
VPLEVGEAQGKCLLNSTPRLHTKAVLAPLVHTVPKGLLKIARQFYWRVDPVKGNRVLEGRLKPKRAGVTLGETGTIFNVR